MLASSAEDQLEINALRDFPDCAGLLNVLRVNAVSKTTSCRYVFEKRDGDRGCRETKFQLAEERQFLYGVRIYSKGFPGKTKMRYEHKRNEGLCSRVQLKASANSCFGWASKRRLLLIGLALLGMGCGSKEQGTHPPAQVVVTIAQTQSMVDVGQSLQLTAVVQGDPKGAGVTWAVTGGGTLSNQTATTVMFTGSATSGSATVTATAVADPSRTASKILNVVALPTVVAPAQIPPVVMDQPYTLQLLIEGGTPPYSWHVTQGQLPQGLTLINGFISGKVKSSESAIALTSANRRSQMVQAGGQLSRTVAQDATQQCFTVLGEDAYSQTGSAVLCFPVEGAVSQPLTGLAINSAYHPFGSSTANRLTLDIFRRVHAASLDVTWSVDGPGNLSDQAPDTHSITYNAPAVTEDTFVTITATSVADPRVFESFQTYITPRLEITYPFPYRSIGSDFAVDDHRDDPFLPQLQLRTTLGTPPFTWAIDTSSQSASDLLPPGIHFDLANALFTGTAIASHEGPGPNDTCIDSKNYGVVPIIVTDHGNLRTSANVPLIPSISDENTVSPRDPAETFQIISGHTVDTHHAPLAQPLSWNFSSSDFYCGGTRPFVGNLPPGVVWDSTALVSGTPTQPGQYDFTVFLQGTYYGDIPFLIENAKRILVSSNSSIIPDTLPSAGVGAPYDVLLGTSSDAEFGWSIVGGANLPSGLRIADAAFGRGEIFGTPQVAGTFQFDVCAFDRNSPVPGSTCETSSDSITNHYSLIVNGSLQPDFTISSSPNSLSVGVGTQSSTTLTARGFNGLSGDVALTVSGLPPGVMAVAPPVTVPLNSVAESTVTFVASPTAVPTASPVTVTITGTFGGVSHSTTIQLSVTALRYAFLVQGFDANNDPIALAGHFLATPNLVVGTPAPLAGLVLDVSQHSGISSGLSCSGTCTVTRNADGTEDLALNTGVGAFNYHVALNSSGRGRMIETDNTTQRGSGILIPQNNNAFNASAISGSHAFSLFGGQWNDINRDFDAARAVGSFIATSSAVGQGALDFNSETKSLVNGSLPLVSPGPGTFSAPDSGTGRGTITFNFPNPVGTRTFVYYVADQNELLLLEIDSLQNVGLLSGTALRQADSSRWDLGGRIVFALSGEAHALGAKSAVIAGLADFTNRINMIDHAATQHLNFEQIGALAGTNPDGSVSIDGASGRSVLSFKFPASAVNPTVGGNLTVYMIDLNQAFVLATDTTQETDPDGILIHETLSGTIEPQAPITFDGATLARNYAIGFMPNADRDVAGASGVLAVTSGHINGSEVVLTVPVDTTPPGPITSGASPTPAISGTFGTVTPGVGAYTNGYYRVTFVTGPPTNPGPPTFPLGAPAVFIAVSPNKVYLVTEGVSASSPDAGLYILEK